MKFALLGYPLGHSMSPQIHAMLRIPDYGLCSIPPEELELFLKKGDFTGLNVTIPYKRAVLPYCDALSPQAAAIGSVNTLLRADDGRLLGHNTDYAGLLKLSQQVGVTFQGKQVLILGSGGASLTAQAVAKDQGAASVQVVSRSAALNYENVYAQPQTQIIINATPVGMYPHTEESPIRLAPFPHLEAVLDLIYNPLHSRLLQEAVALGLKWGNGIFMLAWQAKVAEEIFLGEPLPDDLGLKAARQLEQEMCNIVLIGMPGSGKSTVGQTVATALGRECLDIDKLIEDESGLPIPEIFRQEGEAGFRQRETAMLRKCCAGGGKVISCGGGAVLRRENQQLLRQNGRIYLLESVLDRLDRSGRPLSTSPEAVAKMAAERGPIYQALADARVWNDLSSNAAAETIKEDFHAYFGD